MSAARPSCECVHVLSLPKEIPGHDVVPVALEVATGSPGLVDWTLSIEIAGESGPRLCGLSAVVANPAIGVARPGFLVKPAELMSPQPAPPDLVLVDTRSPAQFRVARIPGAWNLPLYTVKTKAFFKSRRLVLFNEGHDPAPLLGECERLRGLGFGRAQVLEGGLRAWGRAGGDLIGENTNLTGWARITPEQFYDSRATVSWRGLWLTSPGAGNRSYLSIAGMTNITGDAGSIASLLADSNASFAGGEPCLIMNDTGVGYEEMERNLAGAKSAPVFYLAGGVRAYVEFLEWRFAQLNRQVATISSKTRVRTGFAGGSSSHGGGCCGGRK